MTYEDDYEFSQSRYSKYFYNICALPMVIYLLNSFLNSRIAVYSSDHRLDANFAYSIII